jgi:general secretion pathway protein F/type IV pilus assembly protein PilC
MAYQYVAVTTEGQRLSGRIEAESRAEAMARIREMGQQPVQLREAAASERSEKGSASSAPAALRRGGRISAGDIVVFTRQLADMILSGLTLDRSLTVLAEQSDTASMRALIEAIQTEVRGGTALSQALQRHPRYFPPMVVNMIHAGEVTGQLGEVLERLSQFAEREQQRRAQIVSAMVYPAVLLFVATSTLVFLLTFVVPRLSGVFEDLGAELPLPTRLLLLLTGALTSGWWAILGVGAVLILGFRTYRRTEGGAYQIDRLMLQMALMGKVWRKVIVARFARALGTLVAGGVPILEALRIAGQAAANRTFIRAAGELEARVKEGETISTAMRATGQFPPVLIHMTAVGEETGDLSRVLLRVAETLDSEAETAMKRLTTLIEPAIVIFMGGFVGFVVLSILLPVFQANSIVQ